MESTLIAICGIVTLYSAIMALPCVLVQRRLRWLIPDAAPLPAVERLGVVVPARDEAVDLAAALHSILAQEGVDLEVTVVNDHSTDRTGEIADAIARADPRVRVIHDPPLPPGWLGKCNAMQRGAAGATGDYLLFADADVVHAPTCFATALRAMRESACDFFSLLPRLENWTVWEHANVPLYVFGIAKLLAVPGLEDPDSPNAVASGALMLVEAEAFRAVGGFGAVRGAMLDDVGFARLLKAHRYRVGFRLAPDCARVRLFKTPREAFWGLTKNVLVAVEGRRWLAIPLVLLGFVQLWTPLLALALGAANADGGLLLAGLTTYGVQYLGFFAVRRLVHFRPGPLLVFPLAALVAACCMARALYYSKRGAIFWRGREIRVRGRAPVGGREMSDIEVLTSSVGEGGRNDEKGAKLVRRRLDDGRAREAGEPGGRSLPVDGPMEPDTLAAIRSFRAWSGLDPDGRVEPGDPAWDALAAYHLAGVRSGRILPEDLAFVPLRRPGDSPLSEADLREAFDVYLRLLRERL